VKRTLSGVSLAAIVAALLCGSVALIASLIVYALIDVTLGTVFASVFIAGLVSVAVGPLARNWREVVLLSLSVALASSLILLLGLFDQPRLAMPAVQLVSFLIAFSGAIVSVTSLLSRGVGESAARGPVTIVLLAWLTWPVWMSPAFGTSLGTWMIDHAFAYQPLMALNGAYHVLGDWSHSDIAYKYFTNLGQDVLFEMPPHAWHSTILHGTIAFIATALIALQACSRTPPKPSV